MSPRPDEITFDGRNIHKDPEARKAFQRRIGYVPEEPHLYPHLSGREHLQLVGRLRGLSRHILEPKMDELLRLVGLWEDRHSSLAAYSKGMRQKILLIAALFHDPEVLILDEPFSGLDVNAAMILRSLLRAFAERGKMVLYSSHVLEVVEKVCDKVLILSKGRVVAHDSVARLRELNDKSSLEDVFAELTQTEDADLIAQTHARSGRGMSPRRGLLRHFLETFFDGEGVAVSGEWKKTAIGILAAFLSLGILRFSTYAKRYAILNSPIHSTAALYRAEVRSDLLIFIGLAFAVTATLTLLQWQSLFPNRRDCLAFAGLPISAREIFLTKSGALMILFAGYVLSIDLPWADPFHHRDVRRLAREPEHAGAHRGHLRYHRRRLLLRLFDSPRPPGTSPESPGRPPLRHLLPVGTGRSLYLNARRAPARRSPTSRRMVAWHVVSSPLGVHCSRRSPSRTNTTFEHCNRCGGRYRSLSRRISPPPAHSA